MQLNSEVANQKGEAAHGGEIPRSDLRNPKGSSLGILALLDEDLSRLNGGEEMMRNVGARIGKNLKLSLCAFIEIKDEATMAVVNHVWHQEGAREIKGVHRLADFLSQDLVKAGHSGEVFVVHDISTDSRAQAVRAAGLKVNSFVCVPFIRDGRWRSALCVGRQQPYSWPSDEVDLIREVSTRVWSRLERFLGEHAPGRTSAPADKLRRLYDTILSNTPDFVYVFDLNHRFIYDNPALLKMWGKTSAEAQGKTCLELGYEPWHAAMHGREINQVVATKKPCRGEVPFTGTHGRRIYDYIFAPVFDENGEVEAVSGITRDVTEQHDAAAALAEAKEQLLRSNQNLEAKVAERTAQLSETIGDLEAFSHSIAHDLRAPLRSIQGFGKALTEEFLTKLDEAGQRYLKRITAAAKRMDELIVEVLDYSKISRDNLVVQSIDLHKLLTELVESYPMFREIKDQIQIAGPIPRVNGNPAAVTQCLLNLLSNAIKFVAPGTRPHIRIFCDATGGRVKLLVKDNGIGIPADQREKIFNIFYRANNHYEGTGIGLAIVKRAMQRMGGSVGVLSDESGGSTFWLEFQTASGV